MADLNRVFLAGNLTRDPEIRYAKSGEAVADLQLATNRKWRDRDGKDQEEVCYIGVVVWGRQAEPCGKYLHKGSPVLVEGRLKYETWEKDGQKRSVHRVQADRVQFLDRPARPGGGEAQDGDEGTPPPPRSAARPAPMRQAPEQDIPKAGPGGAPDLPTGGDEDNLPF